MIAGAKERSESKRNATFYLTCCKKANTKYKYSNAAFLKTSFGSLGRMSLVDFYLRHVDLIMF